MLQVLSGVAFIMQVMEAIFLARCPPKCTVVDPEDGFPRLSSGSTHPTVARRLQNYAIRPPGELFRGPGGVAAYSGSTVIPLPARSVPHRLVLCRSHDR